MFLEVEEGGQDLDEEAVKVYLIRFIADLPLRLVYGMRDRVPLTLYQVISRKKSGTAVVHCFFHRKNALDVVRRMCQNHKYAYKCFNLENHLRSLTFFSG